MRSSVRFAGMGGQGIIFAGVVFAQAVSLYDHREGRSYNAIQTQSYGPAARGESSKCDVAISDEPSFYPFVEKPDFLVVMSQPAYQKYVGEALPSTVVVLEEDAVEDRPDLTYYEVPALRKASELGSKDAANMVMLGAFVAVSGLVDEEAVSKAISEASSLSAKEANEKAYREGLFLGHAQLYQD
ncbi:MAG: 2-oxoacid:acceptor oxidoreductase family protein [Methanomassiliicoccales archaeon]|nr:2-oxoacid:acceptor oxidoreductase family protein [Methanomassiliicoccales archaeon]